MSEYQPVRHPRELLQIDQGDMMAGYYAGLAGAPFPGETRSRSYWHGWRNGRVIGGHDPIAQDQAALASLAFPAYSLCLH